MIDKSNFKKSISKSKPKVKLLPKVIKAFIVGGIISLIGQTFVTIYTNVFNFEESTSVSLMISTLIFLGSLLTVLGIYDKIGQFAGAGSLIPVTGFANTMTSAALEYKNEGIVSGIAANMFKLAGAVIAFGVLSAYVFSIIRYLFGEIL